MNEFVKVAGFYANRRLSPITLARYLWTQTEQFLGSEGKSVETGKALAGLVPPTLLRAVRVARLVFRFLYRRAFRAGRPADILEVEADGQLAIVRRSGAVKVLDIERGSVATIVASEDGVRKLVERIESTRRLKGLPFVPELRGYDLERAYYVEEFVPGTHPLNFRGCGRDFGEVYRPLLTLFLTSTKPLWVDSVEYIDGLRRDILDPRGLIGRLEPDQRRLVESFVKSLDLRVPPARARLPLVLSHGDFFSGNIVIDGDRHVAIDWANIGHRSPMHDLYYLYLNHCWRVLEPRRLSNCLDRSAASLRDELRSRDETRFEEISRFLADDDWLRRLFYLECVQVPITRCTDGRDRYLTSMLERIGWFQEYEQSRAGESRDTRSRPGPLLSGWEAGSAGSG